jgi:peptidoglycan hydrolase CwlO-like protein
MIFSVTIKVDNDAYRSQPVQYQLIDNLKSIIDKLEDAYADLSLDNQKLLKNLKETNESLQSKENEIQQLKSNLEELKMRLKTSVRSF